MSDSNSIDKSNDQLGSLESYDLGESAIYLNELPVVIPSPTPEEQLGDISVGELDDSMESVVSATARRQALRRQIQETQENLEQLRFVLPPFRPHPLCCCMHKPAHLLDCETHTLDTCINAVLLLILSLQVLLSFLS